MSKHADTVTLKGNTMALEGKMIGVGDSLPAVELVNTDLGTVSLGDYLGKVLVVSVVPSLDTPVCDLQTRRFNQEAVALGDQVNIVTISMDLPFAQKRWCGAAGADRVVTLSDHREAAFGLGTGLLIKALRLLARAVLVVDPKGTITYMQIVPEVGTEPDYDAALAEVKKLTAA